MTFMDFKWFGCFLELNFVHSVVVYIYVLDKQKVSGSILARDTNPFGGRVMKGSRCKD